MPEKLTVSKQKKAKWKHVSRAFGFSSHRPHPNHCDMAPCLVGLRRSFDSCLVAKNRQVNKMNKNLGKDCDLRSRAQIKLACRKVQNRHDMATWFERTPSIGFLAGPNEFSAHLRMSHTCHKHILARTFECRAPATKLDFNFFQPNLLR